MVQENSLNKLLVICGPTASGKTALAVECARLLDSEVVSADSMLVYKRVRIGAAKPSEEEMGGIVHHMIDIVEPFCRFSVGDYRERAVPIIDEIVGRGKIPVVCGGTGFYINSILYNLSYGSAPASPIIREKYNAFLIENGKDALYALLSERDPETAASLHPNDTRRVMRALEILDSTGVKKSDICDSLEPNYDYLSFSVDFPRHELYERIDRRVDKMMDDGLIDEVRALAADGIDETCQCMSGIGYKEVLAGIRENASDKEIADEVKLNTRRYSKRQITFFKRDPRLELLPPSDVRTMAEYVVNKILEK